MQRKIPTVWVTWGNPPRAEVYDRPEGGILRVGSPDWFAWLADGTTTRFAYAIVNRRMGYVDGFLTIRKERRVRGGTYWVAYRRIHGRLWKRYLGATSQLTCAYLETIAAAARAAAAIEPQKGGASERDPKER